MVVDRGAPVIVTDLWRRPGSRLPLRCDAFAVDSGRSFAEAWTMAARHLARTGRARHTEAALRFNVTIRTLPIARLRAVNGSQPSAGVSNFGFRATCLSCIRVGHQCVKMSGCPRIPTWPCSIFGKQTATSFSLRLSSRSFLTPVMETSEMGALHPRSFEHS